MKTQGACADCKTDKRHKNCKLIGEPVLCETSFGRGKDYTEYTAFQCGTCGSFWLELEDSGAGGHGRFEHRITKDKF